MTMIINPPVWIFLQVCGANAFFTPADEICANQPCRQGARSNSSLE